MVKFIENEEYEPIYNPPLKKGFINPITPKRYGDSLESHQIKYLAHFLVLVFL